MWGTGKHILSSSGRNDRLFREAMRRFTHEIDAIFARHSAAGNLKSGGTIKALIRAMDDTTAAVVNDGLNGISSVTEHAGRRRKELIDEFTESLNKHHKSAEGVLRIAVERIGLASEFAHAAPMIYVVTKRHHERIADFAEGWTAPVGKPWHERHPVLFGILAAGIGSIITWLGDRLI